MTRLARTIAVIALCLTVIPFAQGQTEPVTVFNIGPEGAAISSIVVDPQNPATLYAVSSTGLFKSNDGGTTWDISGLIGLAINSVLIDPLRTATLYAAAGGTLFNSFDAGATWNQVPVTGPTLSTLALDPQNQGTLYVVPGGVRGLLPVKSRDFGATWQPANLGIPDGSTILALAIDPHNTNTLYAVGYRPSAVSISVFKSTDGGAGWKEVASRFSDAGINRGGLVIDPDNTGTLYMSTVTGVIKSTDGGRSWVNVNSGLSACCRGPVLMDPQNPATLYAPRLDGLIFKSSNGGRSWSALNFYTYSLTIDPRDSNTFYAGMPGGAFKSTDGGLTWSAIGSELRALPVSSAVMDPQNPDTLYAAIGSGRASRSFKSTDAGKTWAMFSPGFIAAIDPQNPNNLYSSQPVPETINPLDCDPITSGVFTSVDAGMNWADTGLRDNLYAVIVDPQNPRNVYAATEYSGVVKSIDGGGSWTQINAGLPTKTILALGIDPQNPQILYASAGLTLFKSTDGGTTWTSTTLSVTRSTLSAVAVDPQNTGTVYAVDSTVPGGLWKSMDQGASWQNLSPSAEVPATVYGVAVSPTNPGTLYAGTNLGVMTSSDGGGGWLPLASGVGPASILLIDPKRENSLYAGGRGGLFRIAPPTVTAIAFDLTLVSAGASYTATIDGLNLDGDTYFDVQVRPPGSTEDMVALNWQTGPSASHSVPSDLDTGTWTVTGVRAHQDPENHTGRFASVSATIAVSP